MSPEGREGWSLYEAWLAGCVSEIGLAVVTAVVLVFIVAPYGRHNREGWGPEIPNRAAWVLMESPAVLLFTWWFLRGGDAGGVVPLFFFGLWQLHYVHRTFVFPFRTRTDGKTMPALVALLGTGFNTLNAWLNATWISTLADYDDTWFLEPACWVGTLLFLAGMMINVWADTALLRLREDGSRGYKVPRDGLFEWVSSPNYLGEIVEWAGWAVATWSLAGLAFWLYVLANLVPRAVANHAWYRQQFPDYPRERRALVPFLF